MHWFPTDSFAYILPYPFSCSKSRILEVNGPNLISLLGVPGNPCSDVNNPQNVLPIGPIEVGSLAKQIDPVALPPALPPTPVLENADVVDPPLPPVSKGKDSAPASAPSASGATKQVSNLGIVITLFLGLVCLF